MRALPRGNSARQSVQTARARDSQAGVNAATPAFWNATLKQDETAKRWLRQDFKATLIDGDSLPFK